LVTGIIVNERKDRLSGSVAHVGTGLADNLLESLHHSVLHANVGSLRSSNEF
jgi:hypothetical protein